MRGDVRSPFRWCVGLVAILSLAAGSLFTSSMVAQGVLAQLGLTDASARTLLFEEMKSQTAGDRAAAGTAGTSTDAQDIVLDNGLRFVVQRASILMCPEPTNAISTGSISRRRGLTSRT
jgi:hypothetical protein